ncbi:TIGR03936 family radical SAM-associated protein [Caminicella sporogenes]|uniref:TIGR03936 family radical SAM-associated protein n=1 Tax=Caminicella sporogenes TaxID=166485 RepID=UPI0025403AA1|nr:TIGR03936 family radical SAM-associated protein [Caminicella sporogenes]WIF94429.1 TIGR03936 family radical SAM-associated protein [Caminicella sporogenes]
MYKILVKFTKKDRLKFISHLELMKVIERALRRANIPLKFTQGFNPHPIISFASPLPVGVSSEGEYLTLEVTEEINLKKFIIELNEQLPHGIEFIKAKYIDVKSKSLMSLVEYGLYAVKCKTLKTYTVQEVENILNNFLLKKEILYNKIGKRKKVKKVNIREEIREIIVLAVEDKNVYLKMTLATGSRGNLKPEIVVEKLVEMEKMQIDLEKTRVHRLQLFALSEDERLILLDNIIK